MATSSTDKLAPRIIINENEILPPEERIRNHPITLMFGFAPVGRTCEMVACNSAFEIQNEFGFPVSAPEKWFMDAATRVVQNGATVLMTRLPYDNDQSHTVKYVDYKVESPIAMKDIVTVPQETAMRDKDDIAVTILKEMHDIDPMMTQVQRIAQISDDSGQHIFSMTNDELVELDLDPRSNLAEGTFRIVDVRCEQYGTGVQNVEYDGIFPVITTAPMALYFQERIENNTDMDKCFQMMNLEHGIEMSTEWWRQQDPLDDEYKKIQSEIVHSIDRKVNFDTATNRFHRGESFQDSCIRRFPAINLLELRKLEREHLKDIGVLVCGIQWNADAQKNSLVILESYFGKLGAAQDSVDRKINSQSKYIRMYKNLTIPVESDFFVCDNQILTSIGMEQSQCGKYINYKTSIMDPIQYMLESIYSDVDSIQIDTILDCGLSSTAFLSYVASTQDGETYQTNPEVRTRVDWT